MHEPLPAVEILRRTTQGFTLAWDEIDQRDWVLPLGVNLTAKPPTQFGFRCRREGDGFVVQVRWDERRFAWYALSRSELLRCDLVELLAVLGVSLWSLLEAASDSLQDDPLFAA
jgi:hypothetical protein